jgi:hypothetical protein
MAPIWVGSKTRHAGPAIAEVLSHQLFVSAGAFRATGRVHNACSSAVPGWQTPQDGAAITAEEAEMGKDVRTANLRARVRPILTAPASTLAF